MAFIQWLEPQLTAVGMHCSLTGSVIFKGSSENDMDIVIYPHKSDGDDVLDGLDKDAMLARFSAVMKPHAGDDFYRLNNHNNGAYPEKRVICRWRNSEVKIDFFLFN